MASCPKMRTEPKSLILEALSKFAETSRRCCELIKRCFRHQVLVAAA